MPVFIGTQTAMTLELYFHPLSSFCHKVLIALYENDTPFEPHIVNLGDDASRTAFRNIWPIAKFPVMRDSVRDQTIPESSIIIEYLDLHYPGRTRFFAADAETARQTRQRDRFLDLYLHLPMQKIVTDQLRPQGRNDPHGVEEAKALLNTTLDMLGQDMASRDWAMGERFSLADCAAAPPLFYIDQFLPLGKTHKSLARYLGRLTERLSYARVLREAQPYLHLFPNPRGPQVSDR